MGYQRRVHGDSSIGSKRRTMIKIAILVCLAALAAAEADADAYYGPYGYSQYSQGYSWPMYSGNMWSMHHGYSYGKRSADAEPTAEADAYYRPYSGYNWNMNSAYNMNNNWNMNNMNNNWNMNNMNNNWNMNSGNMWNRNCMQGYCSYNSYHF